MQPNTIEQNTVPFCLILVSRGNLAASWSEAAVDVYSGSFPDNALIFLIFVLGKGHFDPGDWMVFPPSNGLRERLAGARLSAYRHRVPKIKLGVKRSPK
ncbi:hypothetical protein OZ411_01095 [Bradyrhizobium sp. Arg237L]|uniref:hypothetical protein n=1 Tax=Bradyrhizobium sp. Arg237L TaxID=3003352 RepID=UPI00249E1FCE|nr:hypothetical protein [Bradyrhizobium sp. Arg237L]MDI4231409.1 hypothetical protein [Bradyrhizobium sp. Arg237L]